MECEHCKDPIYKFQKSVARTNREGKKIIYHEGCYKILLDEVVDKAKNNVPDVEVKYENERA